MRRRQIKRQRPTLQTVYKFLSDGSYLIDPKQHYLSDKEREAEIQKIGDDLCQVVKREFPRTQNLEYALLKAHLIIEYALVQYIRAFVAVSVTVTDIRFSFSQKLEIAYLLGFGAHDPILLPTINLINKARNQVAHNFRLDRSIVDELLRINHDDHTNYTPKNDRERIGDLRIFCTYVCGRIAGEVDAAYAMLSYPDLDS